MPKKRQGKLSWKQRKAIQLLVSGAQSEAEVAEYLCVHLKTVQRWLTKDELFIKTLEERFQNLEMVDAKYRAKMNKHIVRTVYGEIIKRLSEGKTLKKVPLNKLLTIARAFNHEIRVDTPGDVTSRSRVEHNVLEDLNKRYKENQGRKPELSLVEPPEDEEEVSNG